MDVPLVKGVDDPKETDQLLAEGGLIHRSYVHIRGMWLNKIRLEA